MEQGKYMKSEVEARKKFNSQNPLSCQFSKMSLMPILV